MPETGPEETPHSYHPEFSRSDRDADMALLNGQCHVIAGTHYCHANEVQLGSLDFGATMVFIGSSIAGRGQYMAYTPEGARHIAGLLLRIADDCEKTNTDRANAQLAATLARGAPEGSSEGGPA